MFEKQTLEKMRFFFHLFFLSAWTSDAPCNDLPSVCRLVLNMSLQSWSWRSTKKTIILRPPRNHQGLPKSLSALSFSNFGSASPGRKHPQKSYEDFAIWGPVKPVLRQAGQLPLELPSSSRRWAQRPFSGPQELPENKKQQQT